MKSFEDKGGGLILGPKLKGGLVPPNPLHEHNKLSV